MKHILVVVDMQKDFVDGTLGTPEAAAIVYNVVGKINAHKGEILVTYDTHTDDYMDTAEGKRLPVPHCIKGTDGWQLDARVAAALRERDFVTVEKPTFGSVELSRLVAEAVGEEDFTLELVGLCTDICVVSNALLLKAHFPEADMSVDASCCAGVTPASHAAALSTMASCQIRIVE